MAHKDRTLNGAYRKMLRATCVHIGYIVHHGGADDMFTRDRYEYLGERKGGVHFQQPKLRNIIWFPKDPPIKEQRAKLLGKRPIGEAREHFAYYQTVQNDRDQELPNAVVHYQTTTESTVTAERESMLGWNWSLAVEAQAGGGESSGGSYVKVTGETGMEGSETNRSGTGGRQEDQAGLTLDTGPIAPHSSLDIDQLVKIQDVEQDEMRSLICNLSGKVVGYKKLEGRDKSRHWLHDSKDRSGWSGKSAVIFAWDSLEDLYEILTGGHKDYPRQKKNLISNSRTIRNAWEWLSDEDNRTIEYVMTREIEDAFHGHCRVAD